MPGSKKKKTNPTPNPKPKPKARLSPSLKPVPGQWIRRIDKGSIPKQVTKELKQAAADAKAAGTLKLENVSLMNRRRIAKSLKAALDPKALPHEKGWGVPIYLFDLGPGEVNVKLWTSSLNDPADEYGAHFEFEVLKF